MLQPSTFAENMPKVVVVHEYSRFEVVCYLTVY